MWTQRDQIQAYQFLRRRLVSALVAADSNHPTSPSKRLVLGTVLGLAATLLTTAVFGAIGLLSPTRAEEWRQGGQVIVEQETGAVFILGADDALHPVLNYASARLLAGGDGTKTAAVPAKSLRDVPRGDAVGIAGAPDSLPQPDRLVSGPWTRCTRTSPDRPTDSAPISTVLLGQDPGGSLLRPGQAVLVKLDGDRRYLVTDGQRYKLADGATVTALGYDDAEVLTVAPQWLNTIPAGRDLATIDVPQAGQPGASVGGQPTKIGQVLTTGGSFYLVRPDGLAVITETEARLALGASDAGTAYAGRVPEALPVAAADVASAPRSAAKTTGYPRLRPVAVTIDQSSVVCTTGTQVTVGKQTLAFASPPVLTDPKARAATEVSVPGGTGAVVQAQPTPGAASGTTYVITDTGRKYPVVDDKALAALGYSGAPKAGVPADVLALFPTGVTLDANAAARTVPT